MISDQYSIRMPDNLSPLDIAYHTADVLIRDIGYIPLLGAAVGIPRICLGIFQKTFNEEGHIQWNEGDGIMRFRGSRASADGEANIIRGIFETACLGLLLLIYDKNKEDRWVLIPGLRN